jgi:hypothetical protein
MDNTQPKKPGGAGAEKTLSLLGSLANVAGGLIFGPDFNVDLSAPFTMGANFIAQNKKQKELMDVLGSNPHTAPLLEAGQQLANQGGLMGVLSQQQQPAPIDFGSQEFISSVASKPHLADLAQQLIFAQSQKKAPDILDQLSKMADIQYKTTMNAGAMSDVDKLQAKFANNLILKQIGMGSALDKELLKSKIRVNEQAAKNKLKPLPDVAQRTIEEKQTFGNKLDLLSSSASKILDNKTLSGQLGNYIKLAGTSDNNPARIWAQMQDPELFNLAQQIKDTAAASLKATSGVAASEQEAKRINFTIPQAIDKPEVFFKRLDQLKAMNKYAILSKLAANKNYDISSYGISEETLADFIEMQTLLAKETLTPREKQAVDAARKAMGIYWQN